MSSAIPYRPSIDGLRALAILSVFVFHLQRGWLPGGFVGVDVFFVISGFLITGILYRESQENRFRLGRFYQRRIARIFPAFFVVAFATLWAASWIYSPQDFASAGANLVAAALSVSNMKSMLQGNYFQVSEDAKPFLHYWSLAVEEQFYLLFPILLVLIFRFARRHLLAILISLFAISLAMGIVLTHFKPVWGFFLLPARAWELLAGCILAIVAADRPLPRHRSAKLWPLAGIVLVLASFWIVPEGPTFPGAWALLPVFGTLGILANAHPAGIIERLLGWGPLVAVGKISYSLYLWHWPVFSMVDYRLFLSPAWERTTLKIVLSVGAAVAGYFLVEKPARRYLNEPRHRRTGYSLVAILVIASCLMGNHIRKNHYVNATVRDIAHGGLAFGNKTANNPPIVLIGDSTASMYGALLRDMVTAQGGRFVSMGATAETPLPESGDPSAPLWQNVLSTVKREQPAIVVLVCLWEAKLKQDPGRLDRAIADLSPYCGKIILLTQTPALPPDASREQIRRGAREPFFENPRFRQSRLAANDYVTTRQSSKVEVIDAAGFFESGDGEIKFASPDGQQFYHDSLHLSGFGSRLIRHDLAAALGLRD